MFSLRKLFGTRVVIYGTHTADWMEALCPTAAVWKMLPAVREVKVVNEWADARLKKLPRKVSRTVVIPLMEDHIKNCPKRYPTFVSSPEDLQTFRDKAKFACFTKGAGLAEFCPEVYESINQAKFPCVIKRVDLNASSGVALVTSPEHYQQLILQDPWKGEKYILQEFVAGQREYVTYCLFEKGKLLWHRTYAYNIAENSIRTADAKAEPGLISLESMAQLQKFFDRPGFTGPCNIDYKLRPDGRLAVLEVNPRLGGTLMRTENVKDLAEVLGLIIKKATLDKASRPTRL